MADRNNIAISVWTLLPDRPSKPATLNATEPATRKVGQEIDVTNERRQPESEDLRQGIHVQGDEEQGAEAQNEEHAEQEQTQEGDGSANRKTRAG